MIICLPLPTPQTSKLNTPLDLDAKPLKNTEVFVVNVRIFEAQKV